MTKPVKLKVEVTVDDQTMAQIIKNDVAVNCIEDVAVSMLTRLNNAITASADASVQQAMKDKAPEPTIVQPPSGIIM